MTQKSLEKNVDLLLVDSGDLHDGNGLTDGGPHGSVDAHDANEYVTTSLTFLLFSSGSSWVSRFLVQVPYDVMAIGKYVLLRSSIFRRIAYAMRSVTNYTSTKTYTTCTLTSFRNLRATTSLRTSTSPCSTNILGR